MSWLFSRALVEEYSAGTCSDGEPCAQLNVMPTQHKFWHNDKPMEASNLSRFGLTCAVLTADHGAELLTWFLEASRARTSAPQATGLGLTASDLGSGARWRELSMRYNRATSSWRTHRSLWDEDLTGFLPTLPSWGLMRDGELLELVTLPRFTNARDSGLWRTPDAGSNRNNATPSRCVIEGRARKDQQIRLADQVCLIHGINGRLNPTWVEWLMGWPIGWTDCNALEMAKFHEWQQQHGACSLAA